MNILFVTPVESKDAKERFIALCPDIRFMSRENIMAKDIEDAEVILGNLPMDMLTHAKKLKWIQLDSAGANNYCNLDKDIVLTNASGAYGTAISEHMLGCVLMVMKNLARYNELQKSMDSTNLGSVNTISSSKVLSVGLGDIGSSFAQKMHALGATVYGVRRSLHDKPDYIQELYTMDNMDEILPECDVVALSMPETPETINMFDERRLRLMKHGAILVNVGRGSAIVTNDLYEIMKEEHLSGVCLDVTSPEPLPRNHPLWTTKHVYITPHISGRFNAAVTYDKVLDIFYDNLSRYLGNLPLKNVVDKNRGY